MNNAVDIQDSLEECVRGSHAGTMSFATVVGKLIEAGVESYQVDYRQQQSIYYLPSGATHTIEFSAPDVPIPEFFDKTGVQDAIKGAQAGLVKYPEFVLRTMQSGCVGYFVWIVGRHVDYFGRLGAVHVENFPTKP